MRRRAFTAGLALMATVGSARAQQSETQYRIAILDPSTSAKQAEYDDALWEELHRYGYIKGHNLTIEYRSAENRFDRLPQLAAELVALHVDAIVAVVTPAAIAASQATSRIPIIMVGVSNPIGLGLIKSLAHPGGNVTGTSSIAAEVSGKPLEALKEIMPQLRRVAVLWNPANPAFQKQILKETETAAARLQIEILRLAAEDMNGIDLAFQTISDEQAPALYVLVDPMLSSHSQQITELAAEAHIPSVSGIKLYAESGGLLSYGPNYVALFRRTAFYIDKLLKGANPAELPVEQPTQLELVVNLKAATALGITIPPALLARADEVIE
jgi:putative tryptophan/tyrosine transport system substrate-binding protein